MSSLNKDNKWTKVLILDWEYRLRSGYTVGNSRDPRKLRRTGVRGRLRQKILEMFPPDTIS